jgi:hypothetical protein
VQIRLSIAAEISHLPKRVDTGVGSPGTGDPGRRSEKCRHGFLENRLNGGTIGLHLPAMVIRPVILNGKFDIHARTVSSLGFRVSSLEISSSVAQPSGTNASIHK